MFAGHILQQDILPSNVPKAYNIHISIYINCPKVGNVQDFHNVNPNMSWN